MSETRLPNMGGGTISAKLTNRLMEELRTGIFSKVDRLPAELELAVQYGVSRSVIRDVLSNLEREGFVERGRGIGTQIHRDIVNLNNRFDLKIEYSEVVRKAGHVPSADNVKLSVTRADEDLAERLNVDVGESLIVREKRVLASGRPVIYSIDHLPERLFKGIDWKSLNWAGSVFDLLETHCGFSVDTDIAKISPQMGPSRIRKQLELRDDEALLMVDEVGYYKLSYPILQTYGFYTSFFDFTILRKKF